jgi:hypothetical protein
MQNAINAKHINIEAFSGKRTVDHSNFTRENVDLYKGIQENYEPVNATTNKRSSRSHNLGNMKIDEGQYIQDRTYYESNANHSQYRSQGMEGLAIDEDAYIQARTYYESTANPSQHRSQGMEGLAIDEGRYINDKEYYDFVVNKGRDINTKTLDELNGNTRTSVKDVMQYETRKFL